MTSHRIEKFNHVFSHSAEFRQKIRQVSSLPEMLSLLEEWGCSLTGPDLVSIANQAYHTWLLNLEDKVRPFFVAAHENADLHQSLESCNSPNDVIRLAASQGVKLSEADIQSAAKAASRIEGFSFEKLWFKSLGL